MSDDYVLVKKTVCPSCGSPKAMPSNSLYIYCDYCATFIDVDYKFAQQAGTAPPPDKKYDEFMQTMSARLQKALDAKDREEYGKIYQQFYEMQVDRYPSYYPTRIREKAYRKAYLDYFVGAAVESAFTPKLKALSDKISEVYKEVKWEQVEVDGKFHSFLTLDDLRKIYKSYANLTSSCVAHYNSIGLVYPEAIAGGNLAERMMMARYAEAYMPYLRPADQDVLLKEVGLTGKYRKARLPDLTKRSCGACGNSIDTVKDAKRVICDGCGNVIDVSVSEFRCPGCSNPISLPLGEKEIHCPSCNVMVKAVGQ